MEYSLDIIVWCVVVFSHLGPFFAESGSTLNEDDTDNSGCDDDNLNLQMRENANDLCLSQTEHLDIDNPACSRNEIIWDYSNLLKRISAQ